MTGLPKPLDGRIECGPLVVGPDHEPHDP